MPVVVVVLLSISMYGTKIKDPELAPVLRSRANHCYVMFLNFAMSFNLDTNKIRPKPGIIFLMISCLSVPNYYIIINGMVSDEDSSS